MHRYKVLTWIIIAAITLLFIAVMSAAGIGIFLLFRWLLLTLAGL